MRKTFVFAQYQKLRHGSHQSISLSVVSHSSHFYYYIRIQDKMAINFDVSDLTLSFRKVVQTEVVSEVVNAKNLFSYNFKSEDMGHINQFS